MSGGRNKEGASEARTTLEESLEHKEEDKQGQRDSRGELTEQGSGERHGLV